VINNPLSHRGAEKPEGLPGEPFKARSGRSSGQAGRWGGRPEGEGVLSSRGKKRRGEKSFLEDRKKSPKKDMDPVTPIEQGNKKGEPAGLAPGAEKGGLHGDQRTRA